MFIFQYRENTGNLYKILNISFCPKNLPLNTGIVYEISKIKVYTRVGGIRGSGVVGVRG